MQSSERYWNHFGKSGQMVLAESIGACDRGYEPGGLGSILASEIDKLIDQIRND